MLQLLDFKDWLILASGVGGILATVRYTLGIISELKTYIKENEVELNNKINETNHKLDNAKDKIHDVEMSLCKLEGKIDTMITSFIEIKDFINKRKEQLKC